MSGDTIKSIALIIPTLLVLGCESQSNESQSDNMDMLFPSTGSSLLFGNSISFGHATVNGTKQLDLITLKQGGDIWSHLRLVHKNYTDTHDIYEVTKSENVPGYSIGDVIHYDGNILFMYGNTYGDIYLLREEDKHLLKEKM